MKRMPLSVDLDALARHIDDRAEDAHALGTNENGHGEVVTDHKELDLAARLVSVEEEIDATKDGEGMTSATEDLDLVFVLELHDVAAELGGSLHGNERPLGTSVEVGTDLLEELVYLRCVHGKEVDPHVALSAEV